MQQKVQRHCASSKPCLTPLARPSEIPPANLRHAGPRCLTGRHTHTHLPQGLERGIILRLSDQMGR